MEIEHDDAGWGHGGKDMNDEDWIDHEIVSIMIVKGMDSSDRGS